MKVYQILDHKNQFAIVGEGKAVFQSYSSVIAEISEDNTITLSRDWDYSQTTLKHLYVFLEEYCYSEVSRAITSERGNKKALVQKFINEGKIKYVKYLE